jgi:hypothetical protein
METEGRGQSLRKKRIFLSYGFHDNFRRGE